MNIALPFHPKGIDMNVHKSENDHSELIEDDLDIEHRFITAVPYDSDDSDYEWYLKNDPEKNDSITTDTSEKTKRKSHEKSKKQTSEKNPYNDFNRDLTDISEDEDDDEPVDNDSRNIARDHRNLIASNARGIVEAFPVRYQHEPISVNLNNSYPYRSQSPASEPTFSPIPSYVTPYRGTRTMYRSSLNSYANFLSNSEVVPSYNNYQLLGDSQLLRFSEKILSQKALYIRHGETSKTRYLGYCVSGQKIKNLEERLLKRDHKLSNKVILLIGTNDFLQNSDYDAMCTSYNSIIRHLKNHVEIMILLTVPPVPKFGKRYPYWHKFRRFNDYITQLSEDPMISVLDIATAFIGYDNGVLNEYFEQYYENTERVDMVHLNRKGFLLLKSLLDIHFECQKHTTNSRF